MTQVQVFLVGEGSSDIGDLAHAPGFRRGQEGFFQPLLREMFGKGTDLSIDGMKITQIPKVPIKSPKHLQARNAEQALAVAASLGSEILVFTCDLDRTSGTSASSAERQKRLTEMRESIQSGFERARSKTSGTRSVATAVAVPCRMVEAWALGDRAALAKLVGKRADELGYKPPEELWGDLDDPGSMHPKRVWERVTQAAEEQKERRGRKRGSPLPRVRFSDVGAVASPDVLAVECPLSFPPFAQEIAAARGAKKRSRR